MRYLCVFSNHETLLSIERRLSEVFGEPYCESDFIRAYGYLPIHESYQDTVLSVLKEFNGVYQIKELVEVKIKDDGSQEIIFRNVDKHQFFKSQIK